MKVELKPTMDPHSRSIWIDGLFFGNLLFHPDGEPRVTFAASGRDSISIKMMEAILSAYRTLRATGV